MTPLETKQASVARLQQAIANNESAEVQAACLKAYEDAEKALRISELEALVQTDEVVAQLAALGEAPTVTIPAAPMQVDLDKARFARRQAAHESLSTEFGAWNLGRVRAGQFTGQEIDDWLETDAIRRILSQLRRFSFEAAIAGIQALPLEGPTTQEFKDVWVPKLQAAL